MKAILALLSRLFGPKSRPLQGLPVGTVIIADLYDQHGNLLSRTRRVIRE